MSERQRPGEIFYQASGVIERLIEGEGVLVPNAVASVMYRHASFIESLRARNGRLVMTPVAEGMVWFVVEERGDPKVVEAETMEAQKLSYAVVNGGRDPTGDEMVELQKIKSDEYSRLGRGQQNVLKQAGMNPENNPVIWEFP